jgi:hypothetical protein
MALRPILADGLPFSWNTAAVGLKKMTGGSSRLRRTHLHRPEKVRPLTWACQTRESDFSEKSANPPLVPSQKKQTPKSDRSRRPLQCVAAKASQP